MDAILLQMSVLAEMYQLMVVNIELVLDQKKTVNLKYLWPCLHVALYRGRQRYSRCNESHKSEPRSTSMANFIPTSEILFRKSNKTTKEEEQSTPSASDPDPVIP